MFSYSISSNFTIILLILLKVFTTLYILQIAATYVNPKLKISALKLSIYFPSSSLKNS